ncbi:MAG: sulfite exporter TauE/SafE family protein [Fibromonadales bacterium]|nr:sulfite exporter TauE/SafE family protein [Fibromonadales bacterium]
MDFSLLYAFIFFALGIIVAFINSIAGGASSLSLPIMILLGLPPTVANGTNRLGMLFGLLSSALNMKRYGYLRMDIAKSLLPPTLAGAALGTLLAVAISDSHFQVLLAVVMVAVAIMSSMSIDPFGKPSESPPAKPNAKAFLGFSAVGFYGGFLQVGMGFIQIFALRKYSGFDLKQINAIKNFLSLWFLSFSSLCFFIAGKVVLGLALSMALGGILGGYFGSRFQHKYDQIWIKRFIQLSSIALAAKLIWDII